MGWTQERARVAALHRSHKSDDPVILVARRDLRAARAQEYIERLVANAPPLTAEQRAKLAVLLLSVQPEQAA